MPSSEVCAQALAELLRLWRDRGMPRGQVLAMLRELGLSDDEAEAAIARGVSLGLLLDDGSEVRAI